MLAVSGRVLFGWNAKECLVCAIDARAPTRTITTAAVAIGAVLSVKGPPFISFVVQSACVKHEAMLVECLATMADMNGIDLDTQGKAWGCTLTTSEEGRAALS